MKNISENVMGSTKSFCDPDHAHACHLLDSKKSKKEKNMDYEFVLLMVKMKEADPVKNVGGMGLEMEVEVRATTDELQSNNAVAEDVCFLRQLPSHCILWCQITTARPGKELSIRNLELRN